jgi:ABC-2 type transport system permease protein
MSHSPEQEASFDPAAITPGGGLFGAWVRRNPVALKELRGRMRGARAFVVLTVYVSLMSAFTVLLYLIYTASTEFTLNTTGGLIGKLIFGGVVAIELFLVCFVAPAFTSGAISGERERKTYHLLRTTLLPARRLVIGKLMSALAYVILLLLVAVPLQSLAFLMGGVTIEEVLLSVELLVITSIGYGTVGIFFSAVTKRTLNASVLTYAFALLMTVALPLVTLVFSSLISLMMYGVSTLDQPALEALIVYGGILLAATNPIATAVMTEAMLLQHGKVLAYSEVLSNGFFLPVPMPWVVYTVLYLLVSVVLVHITVRQVRQVEK